MNITLRLAQQLESIGRDLEDYDLAFIAVHKSLLDKSFVVKSDLISDEDLYSVLDFYKESKKER